MSLVQSESTPIAGNPFYHRGPIVERSFFFGRTKETSDAFEMVRNGQCTSIVGPRRIGKTSFLFHLSDPQVQKEYKLGNEYLFVYVDGQALGDLNKLQFYQWLWREAKGALERRGRANGWPESISDFGGFRDAIMIVQEKGYKLAFLFDESDTIAKNFNLDQDLFSKLRSLVPTLVYITASQDGLYDLTYADKSVLSSPFFNLFSEIHLGFLCPKETEEMIQRLLRTTGPDHLFTEEDFDFVFQVAGYHPFFLQLACYHLFKRKMECKELVAGDYASVRQHYAEEAQAHFHYAWDKLHPDEQAAVRLVCEGKTSELDGEQKRLLERKCILYNNTIFSSVFAEAVPSIRSRTKSEGPTAQSAEREEPVALLGELVAHFNEDELRNLCFELRIDYENLGGEGKAAKARELILYCERHGLTNQLVELCRSRSSVSPQNISPSSPVSEIPIDFIDGQDEQTRAKSWGKPTNLVVGAIIAALIGLTSNIVASYLQEKYNLVSDTGRFVIVLVVFVVALAANIALLARVHPGIRSGGDAP